MNTNSYLGLIGAGETAALIGPDLAIGWLCIPRFDGSPLFASALDPVRGGQLSLCLEDGVGQPVRLEPEQQAYRGDSAVLQTIVSGGGWRVEAVDYMVWGQRCMVRELRVQNVTGVDAAARLRPIVEPIRSAQFPAEVRTEPGATTVHVPGGVLLLSASPAMSSNGVDLGVVSAGETRAVRLHFGYGDNENDARAGLAAAATATAAAVELFWSEWISTAQTPAGPVPSQWLEAYRRSLVVMKLLSYAPTGALLAAPTASFPAVPGGGDNWDYRYVWLRDGYYTAMSFDAAGLHEEARRFYDFAFSLQESDGHWRQPLYTVDGSDPAEFVATDLQGPGGEVPIRFGNAASGQLQLDNEGNIVHGLWFHYRAGGNREALERHWQGVYKACSWTTANWHRFESGIWELRQYQGHWVHGKALCYATLEAGARIADVLGHSGQAAQWRASAAQISAEVVDKGWNPARQAYLRHYGEGTPAPCVDISVLALVFYGLLPPDHPRVRSTVSLMEQEQSQGGLTLYGGICRYDYAAVPFYLPTLWLARYYLMAGRTADCDRLLQTCLDCATDLTLMAEHFDGRTHAQWGNFPQAFSHEELARLILERAQGWSFHRWDEPAAGACPAHLRICE